MRRRDLLVGAAAGAAALWLPRSARAAAWGQGPATHGSGNVPLLASGQRAERVLEVFMYGGLSPWESFYAVPQNGAPDDPTYANQQWHLWADQHERVFSRCGMGDPADWLTPFGTDAAGKDVFLGPLVAPWKARQDLIDRLRVVVMRHDLEPHEAAIPYMLGGHRLGNPRLCGMGAHVQRYFAERDGARAAPYSYVFQPVDIVGTDNTKAAEAVGTHPGSARPLNFRVGGSDDGVSRLLQRRSVRDRDAADAYLAHLQTRQRDRYSVGGSSLRAHPLTDHGHASTALANATALESVLGDGFLGGIRGEACEQSADSKIAASLASAVHLLTHPVSPARYVNVVDTGLQLADGGGGYDTHGLHLPIQAMNAWHLLDLLAGHINGPGENDPNKLDLDTDMIVLTTDFGRTPTAQEGGQGSNHHPWGFTSVLLGGPIGPGQSGVVGAIGPDGNATDYVTPSELRAALLASMGMYPFAHESFAVGDIRNVATEDQGLRWLRSHVIGRPA